MNGDPHDPQGLTLRESLRVLRRRWWLVVLVVVVATGAAYFFSWRQTPQYRAQTDLIYEKQVDLSNPLNGLTSSDVNSIVVEVQSVGTVIASPDMQKRVSDALHVPLNDKLVKVSAAPKSADSGTSTTTNVAVISVDSADASFAARVANEYATAFVDWRRERAKTTIKQAEKALQEKIRAFDTPTLKASGDYLLLSERLRDLQILEATVTGGFRVVVPALTPETPFAPKPLRSALLGFAVGLFAGIGLVFLMHQFDRSVSGLDEAAQIMRLPVLARLPRVRKRGFNEQPIVTITEPDSGLSEAFRMLRSNLDFMALDGDVGSIMVTSSVMGEGKSVTVCNLAVTLARAGKRVVVVDADLRRPRVHTYFGLPNTVGVSTVAGHAQLLDSLHTVYLTTPEGNVPAGASGGNGKSDAASTASAESTDRRLRLRVLTSGPLPPNPGEIAAGKRVGIIVAELRQMADIVLVDSPALLAVADTAALASKVESLLFLVNSDVVTKPMLREAAALISQFPCRALGIVLLQPRHEQDGSYSRRYAYYDDADGGRKRNGAPAKMS